MCETVMLQLTYEFILGERCKIKIARSLQPNTRKDTRKSKLRYHKSTLFFSSQIPSFIIFFYSYFFYIL